MTGRSSTRRRPAYLKRSPPTCRRRRALPHPGWSRCGPGWSLGVPGWSQNVLRWSQGARVVPVWSGLVQRCQRVVPGCVGCRVPRSRAGLWVSRAGPSMSCAGPGCPGGPGWSHGVGGWSQGARGAGCRSPGLVPGCAGLVPGSVEEEEEPEATPEDAGKAEKPTTTPTAVVELIQRKRDRLRRRDFGLSLLLSPSRPLDPTDSLFPVHSVMCLRTLERTVCVCRKSAA